LKSSGKENNLKKIFLLLLIPLVFLTTVSPAGSAPDEDVWEAFRYFDGTWIGKGEGMTGTSTGSLTFEFIFNDRFLKMTNRSVFEPQAANPSGEVHEDLGFFSYDQGRKKHVLRQFHIEGFINQYVLESLSEDGKTFVFVSELSDP